MTAAELENYRQKLHPLSGLQCQTWSTHFNKGGKYTM